MALSLKNNIWLYVVLVLLAISTVVAIIDSNKNRRLYKIATKQIDALVAQNEVKIDSIDAVRYREKQSYLRVLAIKQYEIDTLKLYITTTFKPQFDRIDEREAKFLSSDRRTQFIEFGKLLTRTADSI